MSKFSNGNNRAKAKLTNEQVLEIREKRASGVYSSYRQIADEYGVTSETIARICRGDTRRTVPMVQHEPTADEIAASQARLMALLNSTAESLPIAKEIRADQELEKFLHPDGSAYGAKT